MKDRRENLDREKEQVLREKQRKRAGPGTRGKACALPR